MKNDTIELFDRDDRKCAEVEMPPGSDNAAPRRIVWKGRVFQEGGDGCFYGHNQAGEVA